MKLFIREHVLLIAVHGLQLGVILLIFWLAGYRDVKLLLYTAFLSFFFLVCFLIYYYFSRRMFYHRLSDSLISLDDSLQKTGQAPMSEALDHLLKDQYKLYQSRLNASERQQDEHRKFMDQWVHQMKTPLSVIELTAQNLDEPVSSSIREETDRMKNGLNTVLYMARLRTIEQDFHIGPVSLSEIVHDVNSENKRFYIRNKVYPKLSVESESITVETDEKWLFFMLSQFINNAVKYSTGKSSRVDIAIFERGQEAVVEVTDFGVGIPETDERRVFDAFYTGENGRKFRESTGMGLYLTKEAANHLDHRIEMESEAGTGTVFRIIFPETQNLTTM
ncbi:sensor histidine kinase [Virgibacillus siamensis]|uniref:histidine kinase n=1 Tax=Virgibacillus siamensis TaxID=480071 RepID=A0ABP3RH61_9BACI